MKEKKVEKELTNSLIQYSQRSAQKKHWEQFNKVKESFKIKDYQKREILKSGDLACNKLNTKWAKGGELGHIVFESKKKEVVVVPIFLENI